jgi:hypothetical protein
MLCGEDFGREITWHHCKPKYAKGTDAVSNGSLLCVKCHRKIHQFIFGTPEYTRLTRVILGHKGA